MNILGIESSCDETAAAVVRDGREILSNEIFSQADMHALYGGVVPEIASRNHITVISRLAEEAVRKAGMTKKDLDAVAVTAAPGASTVGRGPMPVAAGHQRPCRRMRVR